jgi:hypothetical protein
VSLTCEYEHLSIDIGLSYVGGDVLYALEHSNLSGLQLTCLVRDEDKAEIVQTAYPSAHIVLGSLDDYALLAQEAQSADIVLRLVHL